jgi:hypothetical protein
MRKGPAEAGPKAPAPQGNQWCRGQPQGQFAIRQHRADADAVNRNPLYPPRRSRPTSAGNAWINSNFRRSARDQLRTPRLKLKSFQKAPFVHRIAHQSASRAPALLASSAARGTGSGGGGSARFGGSTPMGVRTRGLDIAIGPSGRLPMPPRAPRRRPSSNAGMSSLPPAGTCCGRRRSGPP